MATVVAADPSGFNRRFIRSAAARSGAGDVREAATLAVLSTLLDAVRPDVVVVDPEIEKGSDVDLVEVLQRSGAPVIVLSSHAWVVEAAAGLGFVGVHKRGLHSLAELEQAIACCLARRPAPAPPSWRHDPRDRQRLVTDDHVATVVGGWARELDLRSAGSDAGEPAEPWCEDRTPLFAAPLERTEPTS